MKAKSVGLNQTEIELSNKTVLVSYQTPVASIQVDGQCFKTDTKFSNTTSKHINSFFKRHEVPDAAIATRPQVYFNSIK